MREFWWRNLDGSIGGMGVTTREAPVTLADLTQWVAEAKGDPDAQRASIARFGDLLFARLAAYDALAREAAVPKLGTCSDVGLVCADICDRLAQLATKVTL